MSLQGLDEHARAERYAEALSHIGTDCESFTHGSCRDPHSGKTRDGRYTSERWCNGCIAAEALDGSRPEGWVDMETLRLRATQAEDRADALEGQNKRLRQWVQLVARTNADAVVGMLAELEGAL